MIEVGGLIMVVGGTLLNGSAIHLTLRQARARRRARAIFEYLPFTPVPRTDPELDAIFAQLD